MTALVSSTRPLPAELAITERSLYCEYDCMDPLARAPTPLPPMFLFDDENDDSRLSVSSIKTTTPQDGGSTNRLTEGTVPESDTPFPKFDSVHSTPLTTDVPRTPGSIRRFAINLLSMPKHNKAVPPGERDMKLPLPENMMDLPEGTEPGSEPGEIVEVLHRSYDQCEGPKTADQGSNSVKMPDTPPASPAKMLSVIQDTSPASTTSTLSPVPSTLSDHGNDEGIRGAAAAQSTPSLPATPTEKNGTTTRGIAQKVTKASKRASANKFSPPKQKEKSVEEFTLLELHSGAFLRQGGLRKSARQAKSGRN
ncbi:hypothetical protein E8E11_001875 [Didymella keratinophila]|nr:hypothetical protein E8E11_001875 [Didymella keratinophila]